MKKKLVRLTLEQKNFIRNMYLHYCEWPDVQRKFDISEGTYYNIIRSLVTKRKQLHVEAVRSKLLSLDRATLGWIAGIIDGEAHIGMSSRYRKRDNSYWMCAKLEVTSTTPIMQKTLHQLFGTGNLRQRLRTSQRHKDATEFYVWRVETIYAIFSVVAPLLIVKKMQGEAVLEWSKRRLANKEYSSDDMDLFHIVRKANHRGKTPYVPMVTTK